MLDLRRSPMIADTAIASGKPVLVSRLCAGRYARRWAGRRLALVAAFALVASLVGGLAPGVSLASFHAVGGSLNVDTTKDAGGSFIATVGGVPYVTWAEVNAAHGTPAQVRVARLDGTSWVAVGGSLNFDPTAHAAPSGIADVAGVPYVVFVQESGRTPNGGSLEILRVARFDGTSWVAVGGSLNRDPTHSAGGFASIASVGGVPYVTWVENTQGASQVIVARFDGTSWVSVGASLNVDTTLGAGTTGIAVLAGVPYVAFEETTRSATGFPPDTVYVKRFDGSNWVAVGGPLNFDPTRSADFPRIANVGGVPYVTWEEDPGTGGTDCIVNRSNPCYVRVAKLMNGGTKFASWGAVGGNLNVDPSRRIHVPYIASVGGVPYVTWSEPNATGDQINVKRFDGTSWVAIGGSLNFDTAKNADDPAIADVGGVPYVTWSEDTGNGICLYSPGRNCQVRVARELAPVCGAGFTGVGHDTPTSVPLGCNEGALEIVTAPSHGSLSAINQAARTVTYTPNPGYSGPDSFSFKANDGALISNTATNYLSIAAAPPAGGGSQPFGGGSPLVVAVAAVSTLDISPFSFAAASSGPPATTAKKKKHPVGARVSFKLNEAASVVFTVQRPAQGRKVKHGKKTTCDRPTNKNRKKKTCTRFATLTGSFTLAGAAGKNRFRFTGRLNGKRLAPGKYRLVATPTTNAKTGPATTTSFRIIP